MVELPPPVLPAFGDGGQPRVRERREDALGRGPVGGELDGLPGLGLLEAFGRQLDEAGTELLGLRDGRADGGPDQWNAWRSLSKNPAWWW